MKATETLGRATYSPEDNKLRFYPDARLSKEDYSRARSAGFKWAPKQELFVAPMWTPDREDLLIEWCGEVEDEDTSLVDRAEQRAERFEDYSDKRKADADAAHRAVESISEHIPLGQPILVGHHSERRARRDAERIQAGMDRAVRFWRQSGYWKERAKSAIHHAKYKERPDVRARRIKKMEADQRRQLRGKQDAENALRFWRGQMTLTNHETGEKKLIEINEANRELIHKAMGGQLGLIAGNFNVVRKEGRQSWEGWDPWHVLAPDGERYKECPACTVEQCRVRAEQAYTAELARRQRWLDHYENRLTYERAMLEADGGTPVDRNKPEVGGACRCWASPGYGKGWSYIQKVNRVSVTVLDNWGNGGPSFTRTIPFDKLFAVMSKAGVEEARGKGYLKEVHDKTGFFIMGSDEDPPTREQERQTAHEEAVKAAEERKENDAKFKALKEAAKAGVQVISAPQLFPTPPEVARRMVDLAGTMAGRRILEPSAGTGNLIEAAANAATGFECFRLVAVEINLKLIEGLQTLQHRWLYANDENFKIVQADFLECNGDLGKFDVVLMNPPFQNGSDIKHIKHALTFLKPGGKVVAICVNGPRQQEQLQPLADSWEELPEGTFSDQGTNVRTALAVFSAGQGDLSLTPNQNKIKL